MFFFIYTWFRMALYQSVHQISEKNVELLSSLRSCKKTFFFSKTFWKMTHKKSLRRTCDSRAYSPNDGKQESHLDVDSIGSLKLLLFLLTCSGCCCLTRCGFLTAFVSSGLALTTFATLLTLLPTCSEFQTKVSSNRSCNTCHRTLNFLQRIQISNLW